MKIGGSRKIWFFSSIHNHDSIDRDGRVGKKRGGIPSNRGSRSKRRGVEFTERWGVNRIVSGLSVGTAFGSMACRPLFSLCYAATEAPLHRSAVGLYTARVPRQSRPGAVRFDVEMIVVANGQFASRSGRPMADRTCTANANKVDPAVRSLPPTPAFYPPHSTPLILSLPPLSLSLFLWLCRAKVHTAKVYK